jgi:hypothetical protein
MSSGSQTQKSQTTPWAPQGEQMEEYLRQARNAFDAGPMEMFGGQMIAGQSADTMLSLDMARELATSFRPRDEANAFIGDVASGAFMPGEGGNPYLDDVWGVMSDRITEAYQTTTLPGLQTRFAGAGHIGEASSMFGNAADRSDRTLARELGAQAKTLYYGDYEARMGDRFRAAEMAGDAQRNQAGAIAALAGAGQTQESYEQRLIDEAIQRFNFGQTRDDINLDQFGQRVGQNWGFGNTTTTGVGGSNPGLSIGLGLMGALSSVASAGLASAPMAGLAAALSAGSTATS